MYYFSSGDGIEKILFGFFYFFQTQNKSKKFQNIIRKAMNQLPVAGPLSQQEKLLQSSVTEYLRPSLIRRVIFYKCQTQLKINLVIFLQDSHGQDFMSETFIFQTFHNMSNPRVIQNPRLRTQSGTKTSLLCPANLIRAIYITLNTEK